MGVIGVLGSEWRQWRQRGDGLVAGWVLLIGAVLYGWLLGVHLQVRGLDGGPMDLSELERTGFPLAFRIVRDLLLLVGLLVVQWGADAVAGERDRGTLRLLALRAPRVAVPLGKAAFYALVILVLAVALLGAALVVGQSTSALATFRAGGGIPVWRGELFGAGLVATLLTVLPLCSLLAVSVAVSSLARSAAVAQAITVGLVLVLSAVSRMPVGGQVSFLTTASWPLQVATDMGTGLCDLAFTDLLWQHLLINALWIAGGLVTAAAACQRKDLA